jgi:hypothetical protein
MYHRVPSYSKARVISIHIYSYVIEYVGKSYQDHLTVKAAAYTCQMWGLL